MAENGELEALIVKEPDEVDGYLVYGDWLEGQGDPRGALVALQADRRGGAALARATSAHLAQHRSAFLGVLADYTEPQVEVEWRLGFFHRVRIAVPFVETVRVLDAVLDHPSSRFLRWLEVVPGSQAAIAEYLAVLLAKGPATLRDIKMGSWNLATDPRADELKRRFPRLELSLDASWKEIVAVVENERAKKSRYRPDELPRLEPRAGVAVEEGVDAATVLTALRLELDEERPLGVVAALRRTFTEESLDAFAAALAEQLPRSGESKVHRWGYGALGALGGDRTATWIAGEMDGWTRPRAEHGAALLARIGTGLALHELYGVATDTSLKTPHRAAAEAVLARVAEERRTTVSDLLDRSTPAYAEGAALERVEATSARRLEQRMIDGRRLAPHELRRYFAEHPLVGAFAERVVWATFASTTIAATNEGMQERVQVVSTFRIIRGEAGVRAQLVDASGQLVVVDGSCGVLHPAQLPASTRAQTLAAWKSAFEAAKITPLFEQFDRPVFELREQEDKTNLGRFKLRRVDYDRLRDVLVTARGWQAFGAVSRWEDEDRVGRGPHEWRKRFERGHETVLARAALDSSRRAMVSVTVSRGARELRFDELDPVMVSEILYDLESAIPSDDDRKKPTREETAALEAKTGVTKGKRVRLGLRANEGKGKWGVVFWIGEKDGKPRCGIRTDDGQTIWADVNVLEKSSEEEIEASLRAKEKAEKRLAAEAPLDSSAPPPPPASHLAKGDRVRWRNGNVSGTGKIFWLGPGKFGSGPRAGVKDDDTGETIWTEQATCERLEA